MPGAHGFFRFWVLDGSNFQELDHVDINTFGADLKHSGMLDIHVYLAIGDSRALLMVKNAIIRITDRNTNDGKNPVTGTFFWYQDYVVREPEFPIMESGRACYNLRGFQDGYQYKDTLLSGASTPTSQAAHLTFSSFVTAGSGTVGVKDTSGNAGSTIKYGYRDDFLYDKLKDLGNLVGCIVQFRRSRTTPTTRLIDFLNPASSLAPRPDGTSGFKTSDPTSGTPDTTRILDFYKDVHGFSKLDEAEAVAGQVVQKGRGTGSGQARGTSGASGRAVVAYDGAVTDDATALAAAQARQNANPDPRGSVEMLLPILWTGAFKAILGDTIAVRDPTGINLQTPLVGQFVRWEYRGGRNKMHIFLNRTRFYDDEVTRERLRQLEQAVRNNQGGQNWAGVPKGSNANSTRPLRIPFQIPTSNKKLIQVDVDMSAAVALQDQQQSGSGGVTGTSGTGTAQTSDQPQTPSATVTTLQAAGFTDVTVGPNSTSPVTTLYAGLPSAPFGYYIVAHCRISPSQKVVEAAARLRISSGGVSDFLEFDEMMANYWPSGLFGNTLRVITFRNRQGYNADVQIFNGSSETVTFTFSWTIYALGNHQHFPTDAGHGVSVGGGHAPGTYAADITLATSLSGGATTSATVDVYLNVQDTAHRVAQGVAIPAGGGFVQLIGIGSGTNQLLETATGQHVLIIVPTTTVFLAGQVNVQSQIEL